MKDNQKQFKYNLQLFAEGDDPTPQPTPQPTPEPTPTPEPAPSPQKTAEEQLTELIFENKKMKSAFDKAASEAADYKKKWREKMSEQEKVDIEKAESEAKFREEFETLRRENTINKMAKSFLALGYTEEQAVKASEAQIDGNTDELFRIQQSFLSTRDKAKEAEWMKNAPTPPSGNDGKDVDAFLKGFDS